MFPRTPRACSVLGSQKRALDLQELEFQMIARPSGCWESNLERLEEQLMLLVTKPSLQPYTHVCTCVGPHVYAGARGGLRLMLSVFLEHFPQCALRHGLH